MLLLIGFLVNSCEKDDPKDNILNQLEGEWDVKSFTEDGVETVGFLFNIFEMEYEEYESNEGDFRWTLIDVNGQTTIISGEYECNTAGDEVELSFRNNSLFEGTYEFDMTIDDDDLSLEGNIDGLKYVIDAEM